MDIRRNPLEESAPVPLSRFGDSVEELNGSLLLGQQAIFLRAPVSDDLPQLGLEEWARLSALAGTVELESLGDGGEVCVSVTGSPLVFASGRVRGFRERGDETLVVFEEALVSPETGYSSHEWLVTRETSLLF